MDKARIILKRLMKEHKKDKFKYWHTATWNKAFNKREIKLFLEQNIGLKL